MTRPGLFGGGLFGGLAAGFLGAGLFGMLFGHGFFGGMAGFASIIGLLLQVALVVIVAKLLFAWWQRRNMPAAAYAAAHPATGHGFAGLGGMLGSSAPAGQPLTIVKGGLRCVRGIVRRYPAGLTRLRILRRSGAAEMTPEMVSYFAEQMTQNASRGLINRVSDVKLLQGDLAEAWREGDADYATVAMRFALNDSMVERASGRTVEGGSPSEVTELWTFRRARGGDWLLSAIQQT